MSLVTTPRWKSGVSDRHRAATSAVLPLPTGPPIPIRKGRSRGKETNLPGGVPLRPDLRLRRPGAGQRREGPGGAETGPAGDLVDVAAQAGEQPGNFDGVETEEAESGRGDAGVGLGVERLPVVDAAARGRRQPGEHEPGGDESALEERLQGD